MKLPKPPPLELPLFEEDLEDFDLVLAVYLLTGLGVGVGVLTFLLDKAFVRI